MNNSVITETGKKIMLDRATDWRNVPANIDEYFGFVYLIENLKEGKFYIGKKFFHYTEKKPPLKKTGKKRMRKAIKETDWRNYWGSSNELLKDIERLGVLNFRRTILKCYKTKWECAYYEAKFQIDEGVLLKTNYYNGIIRCRFPKAPKHLQYTTLSTDIEYEDLN